MNSFISLTSGMRQNLQSLQSTNILQEMTQNRLATGKKVNTALDNPTNFFTALSHTNRANDLLAFKDGLSESIQTIKAADASITAITDLIESAKALAGDAKGALGESAYSQTLTLNTLTGLSATNTINIGGDTFTAISGTATITQFDITSLDTAVISLAHAINTTVETTQAIDASVNGQTITLSPTTSSTTMTAISIEFVSGLNSVFTESSIGSGTELAAKVAQYDTTMTQLDNLKGDADYKGKNLLNSETMTVKFGNDHNLDVVGFDASASGLSLSTTAAWTSETTIDADITKLDAALATLRIESADLSSNLAIISSRDEWISNVANILKDGAGKLTLADANEEGANMLMLQTRQSIGTAALSMSAQAAQSVLRLFM